MYVWNHAVRQTLSQSLDRAVWAGAISWAAYDVAGSAPSPLTLVTGNTGDVVDVTGTPVSTDDLNMLAHFGDGATGH